VTLAHFLPLPLPLPGRGDRHALRRRARSVPLPHLRRPNLLQMIIITIGLSIVIQEAALLIWTRRCDPCPISPATSARR